MSSLIDFLIGTFAIGAGIMLIVGILVGGIELFSTTKFKNFLENMFK